LHRLGISRAELIASESDQYPRTVLWAQALHTCRPDADGLVWVSRQHDTSLALVLFGDRVHSEDLVVEEPPQPLAVGPGYEEVQRAADLAGIALLD
jgi:hypothetical protein